MNENNIGQIIINTAMALYKELGPGLFNSSWLCAFV